jgi:hypothetical protein
MKKPTDTSKLPIANLPPPIVSALRPGSIEDMERIGQTEFVRCHAIPTNLRYGLTLDKLAEDGFVIGPPLPADPLWCPATLPEGWTKRRHPNHSMWSYIYDDTGAKRYSIFYKAAYYDRRADMEPCLDTMGEVE